MSDTAHHQPPAASRGRLAHRVGAALRRDDVVAVLVAVAMAALVAATVVGEASAVPRPSTGWLVLDVAVGVLGIAVLLVVTGPVLRLSVLAGLVLVSPAATPVAATAALWLARERALPVAAGAAVAAVTAEVVRASWRAPAGLSIGWWTVLVVATYAAVVGWGALARARRALVASLEERARRAEADQARRVAEARRGERTRIAREMHDVLAHRLSLLAASAGALEFHPDAPAVQRARTAGVIRDSAHRALIELREVIGVLRDDDVDAALAPPQPTLADVADLVAESRAAGTPVDLDLDGVDVEAVPATPGRTAYRLVQEGLTNARKHAATEAVRVRVGTDGGGLVVEVTNALPTPPPAPVPPGAAAGLVGLRERVALAGGTFDADVTPDGEFRLRAHLPDAG